MMFWRDRWARAFKRAVVPAAAAVLLAACGGGGDQVEPFVPDRVIAFGDENSIIEADGRKYTVNFLDDDETEIDCTQYPIWVQSLASSYGIAFPQCPGSASSATGEIHATPSAKVADVGAQIDAFIAGGDSFDGDDLVTVLAGTHDVIEQYEQIGQNGYTEADAIAALEEAGSLLAAEVNRIAEAGGKVIVSTIPSLGYAPYGLGDDTREAVLHRLSQRFNDKLTTGLINDGRMIGLLLTDESIQSIINFSTLNDTDMACNDATIADVRTCTSQTMRIVDASATPPTEAGALSYLWADAIHMTPAGHADLGTRAFARASNNPF